MEAQGLLDVRATPDEIDPGVEMTRCGDRPVNDDTGGVVTTHGVDGNPNLQFLLPDSLQRKPYSSSTALTGRAL
jgi:hypothetical protein